MNNAMRSIRATFGTWWLALAAGASLGAGCAGEGPSGPTSVPLVCPGCEPRAGGETTDFSPTECGSLLGPSEVDSDEARALGFDVDAVVERMQRPIEAQVDWHAYPYGGEPGQPASGYTDPTQVSASVEVTGFAWVRPDPAHCEAGVCTVPDSDPAITVEQASCAHFLRVDYDVQFETADGALIASGAGEAAQWAEGFESMIGAGTADELHGHSHFDLSTVRGTLQLDPDTAAPYEGVLTVQLDFDADATHGYAWPTIHYEGATASGATTRFSYEPLQAVW